MQRFAVIGLGRFGSRLASNLAAAGQEVIGIDERPEVVEEMRDRVTLAVALDATDEQALRGQGIDQVDCAVVGIGEDFEATVLATVTLKQLGVPRVISRAVTPIAAKVLARIGADEVVSPETEAADRWANRLVSPHFTKHFGLDESHSIVEMKTPSDWVERTLAELNLRAERGLHVVAVKRALRPGAEPRVQIPNPQAPLAADDLLVIMGQDKDLAKLKAR